MAQPSLSAAGRQLDTLPIGRTHRRVLMLIGAGLFLDGFEVYMSAAVLGAMLSTGWSSMAQNAGFVSATFAGMTIGAWFSGILGDRFGRRFSYQVNLLIFGVASLAAAAAPNMMWLTAFRFVMGVGIGAELVVSYATFAEFVPARSRGRWVAYLSIFANSALFVSTLVGIWIIPRFGWRAMFLIGGVAAIIVWVLRKSMPESPRWLEEQGRAREADATIGTMAAGASPLPSREDAPGAAPQRRRSVLVLFTPDLLRGTLIGMLFNVMQGLLLYGLVGWLPSFLIKQGMTIASSLWYTTLMALGGLVGASIGALIADRVGRKTAIVCSSLIAAAFAVGFSHAGNGLLMPLLGFCMVTSIYVFIAVGIAVRLPELFPTRYRLRGIGLCSATGRLATSGIQFAVLWTFSWGGMSGVVGVITAALLLQALLVAVFDVETSQRSLEDAVAVSHRAPSGTLDNALPSGAP